MSVFRLTPAAEADLDEIWRYTMRTWSAERADRYSDDFFDAFDLLVQNPNLGRKAEGFGERYRRLFVGHHLVFYLVERSGDVLVVRILHERSDIPRHLDE
ncbi:type II toxin-antitoxin system RelE/ParE family toxin [Rhizobium sp. SSA_523]|uniref:type II toxin-antitoxin system RelE/ParE family toxin n=1 Tax=Rhizobium sp. SSA_523 TaxID=2952477 RepID=UPI0020918724|nr:type II toxin-antitoxin system RelE/ParE family toxin [Rhizobium sp. SSA_523]MCO5731099.1 type II toxin-antitoxin system RelE/ParE family toxin [Rhizobium sp. SSA_523]WKC24101.1 type II toxin-antitoxin system RelE/ParE family toxin [Rhizobium sp. SSA_523]